MIVQTEYRSLGSRFGCIRNLLDSHRCILGIRISIQRIDLGGHRWDCCSCCVDLQEECTDELDVVPMVDDDKDAVVVRCHNHEQRPTQLIL